MTILNNLTMATSCNSSTTLDNPLIWSNSSNGYPYVFDPAHTHNTNSPYIYTTTTTGPIVTTYSPFSYQQDIKVKRCRNCKHAHIEGQKQCVEVIGQMIAFTSCSCEEYVPEENLEYLEWKYKKQNK